MFKQLITGSGIGRSSAQNLDLIMWIMWKVVSTLDRLVSQKFCAVQVVEVEQASHNCDFAPFEGNVRDRAMSRFFYCMSTFA